MSDSLDASTRLGSPDNDRSNLQGGPDLDTVRSREISEDGQAVPRQADEQSGAPVPSQDPAPSANDPFILGAPVDSDGNDDQETVPELDPSGEDGPTYERNQSPEDVSTGGSTDPNNTLSHSDSGRPVE